MYKSRIVSITRTMKLDVEFLIHPNHKIVWEQGSDSHYILSSESQDSFNTCSLKEITYKLIRPKMLNRKDFEDTITKDIQVISLVTHTDAYEEIIFHPDDLLILHEEIHRVEVLPKIRYNTEILYSGSFDKIVFNMSVGDELVDLGGLDKTVNIRKDYTILSFGYSKPSSCLQIDSVALKDNTGGVTIANFKSPMCLNVPYRTPIEPNLNN